MGTDPAPRRRRGDSTRAQVRTTIGRLAAGVAAWTAIGVVFAIPGMSTGPDWRRALLGSLAQWWAWGLVSLLIVAADRRLPSSDRQPARRFLLHVLFSVPLTAVFVYVYAALRAALGFEPWRIVADRNTLVGALRGMFLWNWLVYWLI